MFRFQALLQRANIDIVDLPHGVDVNGVLVYLGSFPNGCGRLFIHPDIHPRSDDPRFVALIAHELSHFLLSSLSNHPKSVLHLLLDKSQRGIYNQHEDEANQLAAYLLVPPMVRAACPSSRFPTPESLAQALGVPSEVVHRALTASDYDPVVVCEYLLALVGHPYFIERDPAVTA